MKTVDIESLLARLDKGNATVRALCTGEQRWVMQVPARPDEDPDLVLADALLAGEQAIAALEAATAPRTAVASEEPLDGHGIDDRISRILADAWSDIIFETGRAPPDFWVDAGRLGFRPDLMAAPAGAAIEMLIEAEVEKRVVAVEPVDAAAVPVDERQEAITTLSVMLQRVGRVLPSNSGGTGTRSTTRCGRSASYRKGGRRGLGSELSTRTCPTMCP